MSMTANLEIQQTDTASLKVGDQDFEMPVIEGSEGERAVDISRLRSETGLITIDEGYVNTGSTRSAITFLNGEKGILRYRGYPIEQLAAQSDFLETAYLLIYGETARQGSGRDVPHADSRTHDDSRRHAVVLQRLSA